MQTYYKVFSTLKLSHPPSDTHPKPTTAISRPAKQIQNRKDKSTSQADFKTTKPCADQPSRGASEMNYKDLDKSSARTVAAKETSSLGGSFKAQSEDVDWRNDEEEENEQSSPLAAPVPTFPADSAQNQVCTE